MTPLTLPLASLMGSEKTVPLGHDVDSGTDVHWDLATSPHLMTIAPSGAGSSMLLRMIAFGVTQRGWDIVGIAASGLPGLQLLENWPGVHAVTTTGDGHAELVHRLGHELRHRYADMQQDPGLHKLTPLVVLVDGIHMLTRTMFQDQTKSRERAEFWNSLWQLVHLGRSVGIRVALSSCDHELVPSDIRAQMTTRIALGSCDRTTATGLFDDSRYGGPADRGTGWISIPTLSSVRTFQGFVMPGDGTEGEAEFGQDLRPASVQPGLYTNLDLRETPYAGSAR